MSMGYDREPNIVNEGDTAQIRAFLYERDDAPTLDPDIISVSFVVQKPDGSKTLPQAGSVEDDGSGLLRYDDTDQVGQYTVIASFQTFDGKRSARADFEVIDPFQPLPAPSPTWVVADRAWAKLEDCFDAEDEGPWLRDMTLNFFNQDKMEAFIDEALFDINQQNPPTSLTARDFVHIDEDGNAIASPDLPLLTQAVFICVLRHLIRSYVEQPNPTGANIAWHDRRDYLQRWQSVLQIEQTQYLRILALFKRRFLGLGTSALLLGSKAGRLVPAPMRTRTAGRGYW